MSEIGSISSYITSMQQLQMSIVKQNAQAEQQLVEILSEATQAVPTSQDKGTQLDINI